ncbi:26S proteasome non-ATPase regulatory subunit 5 [Zopfochytrium polystomum]|nr:26S proteasome non-ATPase regulatory subunit 5 [Zopfochytrium polystomum]
MVIVVAELVGHVIKITLSMPQHTQPTTQSLAAVLRLAGSPPTPHADEALNDALSSISIALSSASDPSETVRWLSSHDIVLDDLVNVLQTASTGRTLDLACRCIELVSPAMGFASIASTQMPLLMAGLGNDEPRVQKLVLRICGLAADSAVPQYISSPAFLASIRCLASPNLDIAQTSLDLLVRITTPQNALTGIFSPAALSILRNLLDVNETVRFRVFELVVRVGTMDGGAMFDHIQEAELLTEILDDLDSDDVLCRLNAIELFVKLLDYSATLAFFTKLKILDKIVSFLDTPPPDVSIDDLLTRAACLKFFCSFAKKRPQDLIELERATGLLSVLQIHLNAFEDRSDILDPTLVAIGNIGGCPDGLQLLLGADADGVDTCRQTGAALVDALVQVARSSGGSSPLVAVQSLSCIFESCPLDGSVKGGAEACEKWFGEWGGWRQARTCVRSPFDEIRVAAYAVMCGAVRFEWGVRLLGNEGEVLDFLLDRATEKTRVGKEWRFSVMDAVIRNPKAKDTLSEVVFRRIATYVREGPFYSSLDPVVATDMQ